MREVVVLDGNFAVLLDRLLIQRTFTSGSSGDDLTQSTISWGSNHSDSIEPCICNVFHGLDSDHSDDLSEGNVLSFLDINLDDPLIQSFLSGFD